MTEIVIVSVLAIGVLFVQNVLLQKKLDKAIEVLASRNFVEYVSAKGAQSREEVRAKVAKDPDYLNSAIIRAKLEGAEDDPYSQG